MGTRDLIAFLHCRDAADLVWRPWRRRHELLLQRRVGSDPARTCPRRILDPRIGEGGPGEGEFLPSGYRRSVNGGNERTHELREPQRALGESPEKVVHAPAIAR